MHLYDDCVSITSVKSTFITTLCRLPVLALLQLVRTYIVGWTNNTGGLIIVFCSFEVYLHSWTVVCLHSWIVMLCSFVIAMLDFHVM